MIHGPSSKNHVILFFTKNEQAPREGQGPPAWATQERPPGAPSAPGTQGRRTQSWRGKAPAPRQAPPRGPAQRPPSARPPRGDHTRVWRTTHLRRDPARVRPLVRTLRVCDPAVSACGLVFSRVSSKSPLFPAESSPQGTSDTPETTREVYFTVQLFSLESLLLTKQSKRLVPQNPSWVCRARDHSARRADTPGPEEPAP